MKRKSIALAIALVSALSIFSATQVKAVDNGQYDNYDLVYKASNGNDFSKMLKEQRDSIATKKWLVHCSTEDGTDISKEDMKAIKSITEDAPLLFTNGSATIGNNMLGSVYINPSTPEIESLLHLNIQLLRPVYVIHSGAVTAKCNVNVDSRDFIHDSIADTFKTNHTTLPREQVYNSNNVKSLEDSHKAGALFIKDLTQEKWSDAEAFYTGEYGTYHDVEDFRDKRVSPDKMEVSEFMVNAMYPTALSEDFAVFDVDIANRDYSVFNSISNDKVGDYLYTLAMYKDTTTGEWKVLYFIS